jgi:hypothetical protein
MSLESAPVFIFGVPRSGTTLLYRTLLRHSSFLPRHPAPESFFVESKVFQFAGDHNPFLKLFMGGDEQEYATFLKETRLARTINRCYRSYPFRVWMEKRSQVTRARWWRWLGQDELIRCFFHHVRAAQKCNRVLEKTPIHYKFLPEITETFPEARFVWIHRHPVDVYASYRRRGQDERDQKLTPTEGKRWLSVTPEDFAERYREGVHAMRDHALPHPEAHHVLSYENLVSEPERVFQALCDFLEIPFEAACIQGGDAHIADKRDPFLSQPIRAKTKDWSRFLSGDEAARLQNDLAGELSDLGYAHYTSE